MSQFEFKEFDKPGLDTLEAINKAPRFNQWMYSAIEPFCKGRILEIGSGIGNISERFLGDGRKLMLTDIRQTYCEVLQKKFNGHPGVLGVEQLDLADPSFETRYAPFIGTFDTVFALNVVEHIYDDGHAMRNCRSLLAQGGHVIILVPAFQSLFNAIDEGLEHHRRYTRRTLVSLLAREEFSLVGSRYFNALGIPGWFISGRLQKNRSIPDSQMSVFEVMVPVARMTDYLVCRCLGLSVIAVGRK